MDDDDDDDQNDDQDDDDAAWWIVMSDGSYSHNIIPRNSSLSHPWIQDFIPAHISEEPAPQG